MPTGFGTYMADLGMQAGQGVLGGAMGLILEKHNDRRQLEQQGKLQAMQEASNLRIGKEMRDYNNMKDLEMWKATNYSAQKEEIKKAGLNPALLYGMKGGGGVTIGSSGSASGVSGASAPTGGREAVETAGMALQLGLLRAQKENIEADTANKLGDAANKPKVGQNLEASTGQMLANTGNIQADTELKKIQTNIAKIDEWIKDKTKEDAVEIVMWQSEKILNEVDNLARQNIVDKATMNDRIDLVKAELAVKALMPAYIEAQTRTEQGKPAVQAQDIKESQERIWQMSRQAVQKWREIEISGKQAETNYQNMLREEFKDSGLPTDIIDKVVDYIILRKLFAPPGRTETRGFHNRD